MAQNKDDKPKLEDFDESQEYQFSDEGESQNYEYEERAEKQQDEGGSTGSKNRRTIIIAVVVLIVLIVIYGVFSVFHNRHKALVAEAHRAIAMHQNPAATQANKMLPSEKSNQAKLQAAQAQAEALEKVQKTHTARVDQLEKTIAELKQAQQETSEQLKSQQDEGNDRLDAVENHLSNLNQEIAGLQSSINEMNTGLTQIQRRHQAAIAAAKARAAQMRRSEHYYVEAVIPGRAWLKAADGSTVTVTVGDTLNAYGKVLSINPYTGVVSTSAGPIPYGVSGG